jgi:hypothetical protein
MKTSVSSLLAAYFLLCFSSLAFAQNSQLTGLVKDKTDAVVPAAAVTLTNVETGAVLNAKSSKAGFYVFASIVPGRYSLAGDAPGFAKTVINNVKIDAAANVSQDIVLQVRSSSQSVNVVSDPPSELTATTAAVSTVIDRPLIENMPLNGNSLSTLFELTPGVVTNASGGNPGNGGGISVNGQRPTGNYLTIDGASGNIYVAPSLGQDGNIMGAGIAASASGGTNGLLPVDAIEEFRMQTSTYSAEYGRTPGGQIEVITRGGTNAFHGSLFERFRNQVMDAQDWFNGYYQLKQAPLRMNDFGGTFGGPVLKNRVFFFVAHESLLMQQPQIPIVRDVPSQQVRTTAASVFQPYLTLYPSGNKTSPLCPASDPTCDPNQLGISDRYVFPFSNGITDHSTSVRVDAELPRSMHAFFRINDAPSYQRTPVPTQSYFWNLNILTLTSGLSWRISSTIFNAFTINYSSDNTSDTVSPIQSFLKTVSAFANLSTNQVAFYSPWPSLLTNPPDYIENLHQFNLNDTFSLALGRHAVKIGGDYRRIAPTVSQAPQIQLNLFTPANIQAGIFDYVGLQAYLNQPHIRAGNTSLFVADDWKVRHNLTLNLGLRWEYNPPPTANYPGLLAMQGDPYNPSGITLAPPGTPLYRTRYNDFAPRLGFAYSLNDSGRFGTVLRAGGGIFFDTGQAAAAAQAAQLSYPYGNYAQMLNVQYSSLSSTVSSLQGQLVNFGLPEFQLYLTDPNLVAPRTYDWSLTVDQQMGARTTLSASYVGNSAHDLLAQNAFQGPLLPPSLTFGYLYVYTNGQNSSYNALQMQLRHRAQSLSVLASYTFAHALDNGSTDFAGTGGYVPNPRTNSANDIRQIFSSAIHYSPHGFASTRLLRALSGGWALDSIVLLQSAAPFSVYSYNVIDPNRYNQYADVVPGVPLYISGSQCAASNGGIPCPDGKRLNPAAFVCAGGASPPCYLAPPATRNGTSLRNGYRMFGLTQFDLAVRRSWRLWEGATMSFRVDAFDLLNHPSFSGVDEGVGDSTFGIAGATYAGTYGGTPNTTGGGLNQVFSNGEARTLQLSLRVGF